jgi:trans-L-3-hydroxyproline dehydratase
LRVILAGFPALDGGTVLDRRRYARETLDHLRRALMWEPRGHADMYGCIVVPPVSEGADFGVLFTHNEGYSTMCGHGIVAVATVAAELGVVGDGGPEIRVGIDTPAGFVDATVSRVGRGPASVSFVNVPSFVVALDREVEVSGLGTVRYDVAFGGAFYAFVDARSVGLELVPEQAARIIAAGRAIKAAVVAGGEPTHPLEPDLGFLYGAIFVAPAADPTAHSRNVCVFADGEVDRSPTGTGVSARLALHHARGELAAGEFIRIESILGTSFTGRVVGATTVGPHAAVIPEVTGSAHLTGRSEFWVDPSDPLGKGFILR